MRDETDPAPSSAAAAAVLAKVREAMQNLVWSLADAFERHD
jgi:hypothetical protein